jgi:peptidoglycan/xylan/chitin deacetylase (PgdA/CDA1 family)
MPSLNEHDAAVTPFAQNPITRLVKFLISATYYVGREMLSAVSRLFGMCKPGLAVAIYYHQVPTGQRARFAKQMDHLVRWAEPIRADHMEPLPAGKSYVMVTVDDGWISFVENALPELRSRHIPVTMFVIADRTGDSMGEAADHIVSEAQLRSLLPDIVRGLVTIGSHTSTHAYITTLDRREAWRELADSRARLARVLDREVSLFCFPFGIHSPEMVDLSRAAGYKRVFGGMPSPALRDPHEFLIGRVRVDPTDWLVEFHLKMSGAYDWVPLAANLKRRILDTLRVGHTLHATMVARPSEPDSTASRGLFTTSSK